MSLVKNKKVQEFFENYDPDEDIKGGEIFYMESDTAIKVEKKCICVTMAAIKCCKFNCKNEDYYKKGNQWEI